MSRRGGKPPKPALRSAAPVFALDEARFGRDRILNLRASLPTGAQAVRRADLWLRERQAAKAGDVLIITGRGRGSLDGVPVVRDAIVRLFPALRRAGVIRDVREHGQGSFVVSLAPLQALVDAPRRRRRPPPAALVSPEVLAGLEPETRDVLRRLALAALAALGVRDPSDPFVSDEMMRQFSMLAPVASADGDREVALRAVLRRALEEYE